MSVRPLTGPAAGQVPAPRCAWCGGPAVPRPPRLAVCETCGAATTYPPPGADELELAYATWYRPEAGRFSAGGDRLLSISRAWLARRVDRVAPVGSVLDVGSGEGSLLRALRARGREAVGLERTATGEGVIARELVDFHERRGEWAAVVFWHSLEHLANPAAAVDRAVELVAPGGLVAIAVPNLASWQARAFGGRWFHLDLPRHLSHLSAQALVDGLSARGLIVTRLSYWRAGQILFGWLQGLTGLLPGRPDLYSAIRQAGAQDQVMVGPRRAGVIVAATALFPLAAVLSAAEILARAGGTVYVEARRP